MKDNPVRLASAIVSFLSALALWGINSVPADLPTEVETSATGLAVLVAAFIGERIGKFVQGRWTEPKGVLDEIIANQHGEEDNVSQYAKARAHNDTDHLPPNMGVDR